MSWYEEDFAAFLLENDLPVYCDSDVDITDFFQASMAEFLSKYDAMVVKNNYRRLPSDFYAELLNRRPIIEQCVEKPLNVLHEYNKSNFEIAYHIFDELMETLKPYLLITDISGPYFKGRRFFRVRTSETKLENPRDLFHIPNTKRYLITNERFSLAGHPCLYLATYLGIAWEECGRPNQFYYSEFEYQRSVEFKPEYQFISLLSPRSIAQDYLVAMNPNNDAARERDLKNYISTFPLLLACSIVNSRGNTVFKPEYIIPQMLVQWVKRNNAEFKGITYLSCIDNIKLSRINGYNVVLPAIDFNSDGYCSQLASMFKASVPAYIDHHIGDSELCKVIEYRESLLDNMNFMPESPQIHECLSAMYNVSSAFQTMQKQIDHLDMDVVVDMVRLLLSESRRTLAKYRKDDLIELAKAEKGIINLEKKIENFTNFYGRFSDEIERIIESYERSLSKVIQPNATEFLPICP